MNKILFLDIDGVCNSAKTFDKDPKDYFPLDKFMCFLVGKIQLDTGCEVVLSSSWRHHLEGIKTVEQKIVPILDITPDLEVDSIRGDEIQEWLDEHPEVEKYAIIDDDDDMLPEQEENFFQTDFQTGLTDEIAKKVIKHLNSPSN
ncbi:MAG: HAD domain-containing protein [bacterium]